MPGMLAAMRTNDIVAWRRHFLAALEASKLPSPRRAAA